MPQLRRCAVSVRQPARQTAFYGMRAFLRRFVPHGDTDVTSTIYARNSFSRLR